MVESTLLDAIFPHAKIMFAALLGGMVRLFLRPTQSIFSTIALLASCMTCGYFGQPVVTYLLALPPDFDGAIGALLGLIGVSIANGVLRAVDKFDFKTLILNLLGQGEKK